MTIPLPGEEGEKHNGRRAGNVDEGLLGQKVGRPMAEKQLGLRHTGEP